MLLNSLIKRGRKPWWKLVNKILYIHPKSMLVCLNVIGKPIRQIKQDSLRELVSLESGLWQFVCENELVPYKTSEQIIKRYVNEVVERESWDISEADVISSDLDYQYRLLESSLIPEEGLGKFLVDNIVIEWPLQNPQMDQILADREEG